tara:strand:- start:587 stop:886 length:300 start_codon:yes stop_codon:yes gene_type:complete
MEDSDIKYLTHEYRVMEEMEKNIEVLKTKKLKYIQSLEKRFRRKGSLKEGQQRLKDHLERNPKGEESNEIKRIEERLRHIVKTLEQKRSFVNSKRKSFE